MYNKFCNAIKNMQRGQKSISGDSVDMNNVIINYWDSVLGVTPLTLDKANTGDPTQKTVTAGDWSYVLTSDSNSSILADTTEAVITIAIPPGATVGSYDTFTVQINPPTGASITLQRSLPPIAPVMTLN